MNAGWDEEILREEMQAVEAAGFDLDLVGSATKRSAR